MHAKITCTQDKRFKHPISIAVVVSDGLDYVMHVDGRFRLGDAKVIARDIGSRYNSFKIDWGNIEVSDTPPQIETIGD